MQYLVVDDSSFARKMLIKSLMKQQPDAQVHQAENGKIAVDIAKVENIDLVFLDLTMPVMDGYEAIPLILADKPDLPIIVVSADVQPKARLQVLSSGARNHIQKPINEDKMKEILEILI